jgi:subtilisin family serine protease
LVGVRRACGTLFCALPLLLAATAHASNGLIEREALRSALRPSAAAAVREHLRLPLAPAGRCPDAIRGCAAAATSSPGAVPDSIAHARGRPRVLVGARSYADLPRLRARLRDADAHVETVDALGVLAADAPSGAAVVASLRGDPGVAYVEPDRSLRAMADPFDAPDPDHGGIPFDWAYDEVRAGAAIAAAGGGSRRSIAIVDTGLDVGHPDLDANVGRAYDTATGSNEVLDADGHGTFVAGLIAAEDGNGLGGKGVAGTTTVLPVRASVDGSFALSDVVRGLAWSVRHGADIVNLSLAGNGLDRTSARALDFAFFANVLPVAAAGNQAEDGNPLQFPAAFLGGRRGARGIGLSVGATTPDGLNASFSNHNDFVTVAAPGASDDCRKGVISTIPRQPDTQWDLLFPCAPTVFAGAGGRWAYAQGTSFAAPIAAGIAALAWQVEPRLESEQVADVIRRSARQTLPGSRWNEFTGTGVVDGEQAVALARSYDVRAPRARARARRHGARVAIAVARSRDRTDHGRELAGHLRYSLLVSRDGGKSFGYAVRPRSRPFVRRLALRGLRANVFIASTCDRNGNCGVKRLGRFRR